MFVLSYALLLCPKLIAFVHFLVTTCYAQRTLEQSAELSITRDCWRKPFPQVCGVVLCDFCHSCYRCQIFNMLNNFVHEWTFPHSVRAFWAISSVIDVNAHAFFSYLHNSRWLMLTEVKIRARRKMKRSCFPFYYCDEDEDAWEQLIERRG